MSIRAIPLLIISLILYNAIVFFAGGTGVLDQPILTITMLSQAQWSFKWGDLILLITLALLFAEIVKSTFTSTSTLIDHGLSMVVFVAILVEFLTAQIAATSTFFLILVASLIDVIAGYTIGIKVARRDFNLGGDN